MAALLRHRQALASKPDIDADGDVGTIADHLQDEGGFDVLRRNLHRCRCERSARTVGKQTAHRTLVRISPLVMAPSQAVYRVVGLTSPIGVLCRTSLHYITALLLGRTQIWERIKVTDLPCLRDSQSSLQYLRSLVTFG